MAANYPGWMSLQTKSWKIDGGGGANAGAVLKGGVRIWRFTNQELSKTYPFLYVEGGLGGSVGMSLPGILDEISKWATRSTDAYGSNPVGIQGLDTVEIKSAFSFLDIMGATGGTFSAGVAAVASVEAKLFSVSKGARTLFVINAPAVEAKIGVEVNVMSLTGGIFIAVHSDFKDPRIAAQEKQQMQRLMNTPPSQNWKRAGEM